MSNKLKFLETFQTLKFFNEYRSYENSVSVVGPTPNTFLCKTCTKRRKPTKEFCTSCGSALCKLHQVFVVVDLEFRTECICQDCFAKRGNIFAIEPAFLFDLKTITSALETFQQRLMNAKVHFGSVSAKVRKAKLFYQRTETFFLRTKLSGENIVRTSAKSISFKLGVCLECEEKLFAALLTRADELFCSAKNYLLQFNKRLRNVCMQLRMYDHWCPRTSGVSRENLVRLHESIFVEEEKTVNLIEKLYEVLKEPEFMFRFCQGEAKHYLLVFVEIKKTVEFVEAYTASIANSFSLLLKGIGKRTNNSIS